MTDYVLDAWAWVEYLGGTRKGQRVKGYLDRGGTLFTHAVSVAEVVSKSYRAGKDTEVAWQAMAANSKIIVPSSTEARDAGLLHGKIKAKRPNFSLGDAFVLQAARTTDRKVLTGDPDFNGIAEAILL